MDLRINVKSEIIRLTAFLIPALAVGQDNLIEVGSSAIQSTIRMSRSEVIENSEFLKRNVEEQLQIEFLELEQEILSEGTREE